MLVLVYLCDNELVTLVPEDLYLPIHTYSDYIRRYIYNHCVAQCSASVRRSTILAALPIMANKGQLEQIKYLDSKRQPGDVYHTAAMDKAAAAGQLETVTYLHEEQHHRSWTTAAMDGAAAQDHLKVVVYLHNHRQEGCTTAAMDLAAVNGYLNVLEFLHTHCKEDCTQRALNNAADNWKIRVVRFLHQHRTECCVQELYESGGSTKRSQCVAEYVEQHYRTCSCVKCSPAATFFTS